MSYQQPYGQPPPGGQYPPPQQQWGAPPPHHQQAYGAPPGPYGEPQGSPYPPPQQHGSPYPPPQGSPYPPPHQGQYGAPPPGPPQQAPYGQGGYGQYPPPPQQGGGYGAPPGGQFPPSPQQAQAYNAPPDPPSPGYNPSQTANVDTTRDADALRSAMKGLGTNESQLISILTSIPDPLVMANLRQTYTQRHRRDLIKDIEKETSSWFEAGLVALVRGPLAQDVWNLRDALGGVGTKEGVLDDVLLGRSWGDIEAIKGEYHRTHHRALTSDISSDLSGHISTLYTRLLTHPRPSEITPIHPPAIDLAVSDIHHATAGRTGTDERAVISTLTSHSSGQLRAISAAYATKYHTPLARVLEGEFSGHLRAALCRLLAVAEDRAGADAKRIEECCAGPGTKDRLLVNRVVRARWDRGHWGQVRGAYRHFFGGRELRERVRGETSGDYGRLMVRLCE